MPQLGHPRERHFLLSGWVPAYSRRMRPGSGTDSARSSVGSPRWRVAAANAALGIGLVVLTITAMTQTRLFGRAVAQVFGGDLLNVALFGLAAAVVAGAATAVVPRPLRWRPILGAVLSLSPVVLLAYYLKTTPG